MLGMSERTIYGALRRWQRSGGLVSSLAPHPSAGGRGKSRLTAAAEQLVTEAIRSTVVVSGDRYIQPLGRDGVHRGQRHVLGTAREVSFSLEQLEQHGETIVSGDPSPKGGIGDGRSRGARGPGSGRF